MIRRKPLSLTARRQGTAEPLDANGRHEDLSEVGGSIPREGTEQDGCGCAGAGLALLAETCETENDILAICVLRFVLAGYCHDRMQCFDFAIDAAASIHGEQFGLALMTRAVAVVRALRAERNGNFRYLPANCCRISEDEQELVDAMNAVRGNDRSVMEGAITILSRCDYAPRIHRAVFAFAATASTPPKTPERPPAPMPPHSTFH
jgi:hypothetical protein